MLLWKLFMFLNNAVSICVVSRSENQMRHPANPVMNWETSHSHNLLRRKCLLWTVDVVSVLLDALQIHMHKTSTNIAQKYLAHRQSEIWWKSECKRARVNRRHRNTWKNTHGVWAHAKYNHTRFGGSNGKRVKQHQTANERSLDIRLWSFTCKLMFSNNN